MAHTFTTHLHGGRDDRNGRQALRALAALTVVPFTVALGSWAAAAAPASSHALSTSALAYTAMTPVRLADTRTGATSPSTYAGKTLAEGQSLTIDIPSSANVPSNAGAVVVNITAVSPQAAGFLSVYPGGGSNPGTANVTYTAGQTVGNLVTVGLGPDAATSKPQAFTVYNGPSSNGGNTDFTADLEGYYAPQTSSSGGAYIPLTPTRIYDSRGNSGYPGAGTTLTNGGSDDVLVTGGNVPSTASAVVLNLAVTGTTASSFVYAYPTGSTPSTPVANQNFLAGETLSSKVIVGVGTGGKVTVANHAGNADVVVDVDGYFTTPGAAGSLFTAMPTPVRLADTRQSAPLPGGSTGVLPVGGSGGIPSNATAAVLNVTDIYDSPSGGNFLTVFPHGATAPTAADVNYTSGDTYNVVPNAAYATLGDSGQVDILNGPSDAGNADVVVDAFGYFTSSGGQTYTVSPSTAQSVPASGSTTGTAGQVTYTVTGIDQGNTPNGYVDVALFPSSGADAPSGGTFASSAGSGKAGSAAGEGTTDDGTPPASCTTTCSGYIASVNGTATTGTPTTVKGITPASDGSITFVVNSAVADGTIPVIFTEPSATPTGTLQVGSSGQPASGYAYGVGGSVTWTPATAPAGTYNGYVVQSVDSSTSTFEACATQGPPSGSGQHCYIFGYAPPTGFSDSYLYDESGSGTSGHSTQASAMPMSQFASVLSPAAPAFDASPTTPGDVLDITYAPAGASTFAFAPNSNGDVPGAPSGLSATPSSTGGITLWWLPPGNPDVYGYNVYRAPVTNGTVGSFALLGGAAPTVPASGSCNTTAGCVVSQVPAVTYTDAGAVALGSYEYAVQAVADGQNGGSSGPPTAATPTVTAAAVPPVSTSISTVTGSSPLGLLDSFTVTFSQPITVAGNWSLTITDGTNTGTLNSSNAQQGQNMGSNTVSFLVTGSPVCSPACPTITSGAPGEIQSASGFTSTASGLSWNVAGSGLDPHAAPADRVLATSAVTNAALPAAPDVTAVHPSTASTSPDTVVVTVSSCPGTATTWTAYTYGGAPIGSTTACDSTTKTVTISTSSFGAGDDLLVTSTATGGLESMTAIAGALPVSAIGENVVGGVGDAWGGDNGDGNTITLNGTVYSFAPPSVLFTPTNGGIVFNGPSSVACVVTSGTCSSTNGTFYGLYTVGANHYYLDLSADIAYFTGLGKTANTAYIAASIAPGYSGSITGEPSTLIAVPIGTLVGTTWTPTPVSTAQLGLFSFADSSPATPVATFTVSERSTN